MPKKRRTKVQKERSSIRRREQVAYSLEVEKKDHKLVVQKNNHVVKNTSENDELTDVNNLKKWDNVQQRSLKMSLILLVVLLLVQITIWLIFNFTTIDQRIYDLLKI